MSKQPQAAERSPEKAGDKTSPVEKPAATEPGETVRVRVREGRTIQMAGRIARGGEWVEVDPAELAVPSFRSAVETIEEHGASTRTTEEQKEAAAAAGGSSLFDSMRNVARQQLQALSERDAAAKRAAADLQAVQTAAANTGLARELLEPNRPRSDERPMARELLQR